MDNLGTHVSPGVYVSERQKTYPKRKNNIEKKQGTVIPTPPGPLPPDPYPQHEFVDLGLPSGILWAKENIKDENGNDLYFAWGETQGYTAEQVGTDKNFTWEDYKYGTYDLSDKENYGMTKYNKTDGKTVLDPEDDAAVVNWGNGWRMPTLKEYIELSNLNVWGDKTGVWFSGDEEEDRIGIPFCGYAENGLVVVREDSEYMLIDFNWLSDMKTRYGYIDALTPMITLENYSPTDYSDYVSSYRCCGRTVRPVRQK